MSEKHLYTRTSSSGCTHWNNEGHTGVGLVSRCDCLSSVFLSQHYLQTTSVYTPGLGRLAVLFLHDSQNECYGRKLR